MPVTAYLQSRLVRAGLVLFAVGTGPLLVVIAASSSGLTRDPNPNPIGIGLLAAATFWPSVILVAAGAWRVSRKPAKSAMTPHVMARNVTTRGAAPIGGGLSLLFAARALAAVLGVVMMMAGWGGVRRGEGRGAASMMVLGLVALSWSLLGRLPDWYRR